LDTHTKDTRRGKTRPEILKATERRARIFALRKAGANYREIVAALQAELGADSLPKGYGAREAHRDVTRELARLHRETGSDVVDVVTMELERLNALFLGIWQRATSGDLNAIDRALRIMQRMAELQGVITPVVITWKTEVAQLLRNGILTPAMVEAELGADLAAELFEEIGIKVVNPRRLPWTDEDLAE